MKRFFAVLLALTVLLCALPTVATAIEFEDLKPAELLYIGGIELESGYLLLKGADKAVSVEGLPDDFFADEENASFAYFFDGILMLYNYSYKGTPEAPAIIIADGALTLLVYGENTLEIDKGTACYGIAAVGGLHISGDGSLDIKASAGIIVGANGDESVLYEQSGSEINLELCDADGIGVALHSESGDTSFVLESGEINISSSAENGSLAGVACVALDDNAASHATVKSGTLTIENTRGGIAVAGGADACYEQSYGIVNIHTLGEQGIATATRNGLGDIIIDGGYIEIILDNWKEGSELQAFEGNLIIADKIETNGVQNGGYIDFSEKEYVVLGGVEMLDGDYLAVGASTVSKTAPTGKGYAYYKNDVLTLNNYSYKGYGSEYIYGRGDTGTSIFENAILFSYSDLKIVYNGECTLEAADYETEGIVVYGKLDLYGKSKTDILNISSCYAIQVLCYGDPSYNRAIAEIGKGILNIEADYAFSLYNAEESAYATIDISSCDLNIKATDTALFITSEGDSQIFITNADVSIDAEYCGIDSWGYRSASVDITDSSVEINSYIGVNVIEKDYSKGILRVDNSAVRISVPYYDEYGSTMPIYAKLNLGYGTYILSGSLTSNRIVIGTEMDGTLGDVNSSGSIDEYDYIIVARAILGTYTLSDNEASLADVDKNGIINEYDYILIARHYFGTFVIE